MVVYALKDPIDKVIRYIGITKHTALQRYRIHLKDTKTRQRKGEFLSKKEKWILGLLSKQVQPVVETLYQNLSEELAMQKEQELIAQYKRVSEGGILYNVSEGGHYDSCKATVWNKGLKGCYDEAFVANDRNSQKGKKTVYRFDKNGNIIDEWISIRLMCKELCLDRRSVMRCLSGDAHFVSHKGFMYNHSKGSPVYLNKSTLRTYSNSPHAKRIIAIKNTEEYQFDSIKEAGEKLGILSVNISSVLIGKQKTSHGFIFKYL